uniref:UDP-glucose:glycoprotein glucosyltransferase n=1 Tax=Ananas comosus var. bracteatus TaxID=296719 RepID=A0A6V7PZI1_ANACO|nr:unnamed protein product [Ananas comosus var. bracteatus]
MEGLRLRSSSSKAVVVSLLLLFLLFGFAGNLAGAETPRPKNVQASLRAKWAGLHCCSKPTSCFLKNGRICSGILSYSPVASPRLELYRKLAQDSLYSSDYGKSEQVNNDANEEHFQKNTNPISGGTCCWVDTGNVLLTNVSGLLQWLEDSSKLAVDSSEQPELFEFDHVYPHSSITGPFHVILVEASKKGKVKYVLRPVLPSGCQAKSSYCSAVGSVDAVTLAGYGVELALKNMEYKAMDDTAVNKGVTSEDSRTEDLSQEVRGFIISKILERKPELTTEVMAFRDYLLSSTISDTLEVWELKDLGHQTAQRIVHASDPLQSMQEINQNFPSIVSSLSRMKLDASIKDEILANQRMVPPGKSLMALNGALISIEDIDLYLLMDLVHEELSLADQFSKVQIPQSTIQKLLSAAPPVDSNAFRVDFRSSHVHYLNNLEEDNMYKRWRSNINEILMPVFPGQPHYIRKNLFHAVYVLDPATPCGVEACFPSFLMQSFITIDMILSLYQSSVPMRFGVILYSSKLVNIIEENGGNLPSLSDGTKNREDISSLIIRLFLYIKETYTTHLAFEFLSNIQKQWSDVDDFNEEMLEAHHVEGAFVDTLLSKAKSPPQDVLLKIEKETKYKEAAEESSLVVFKQGLFKLRCCLLMNGLVYEPTEDSTMHAMNEELPRIQEQVYYGHINSHTDVLDKFLSESGYGRYNPSIIGDDKGKKKFVSLFASFLQSDSVLHDIAYLHSHGTVDDLKPVTHLLAVNVASRSGLKVLHEGIRYLMGGSERARIGLLLYVAGDASRSAFLLDKIFGKTASSFSNKEKVFDFLHELCTFYENLYMSGSLVDSDGVSIISEKVYELAGENGLPVEEYEAIFTSFSLDMDQEKRDKVSNFLFGQLGLEFGSNAVITNGRIFTLNDGNSFLSDDLGLLDSVEYNLRIKYIVDIIEEVEWVDVDPDYLTSKFYSDLVMVVSSSLSIRERSSERARFEILNGEHSAVILNGVNSSIHIDAVIDPLSPAGQKLSPLLLVLWRRIHPSMRIVLNPISSLADLPLKNYYRFVLPSMDDYSTTDYSVHGPKAFFPNMPLSKTLTMNIDVPEPWLVEPVVAIHDLDNILLENLHDVRTLQAVFELEALLLTGHCSEKDRDPPRGLQLILGTKQRPHLVDTLVMANLGYWQMKVSPGVWYLQLAPGRSSELYMLKETGNGNKSYPSSKLITINDFRGKLIHLEVEKKRGKEHEDLLNASDDDQLQEKKKESNNRWNTNILKWASGLIGGNGSSRKQNETILDLKGGRHGETINIFSVASGHLYERFLKIMILSVLKNTLRPVKFWFIKNYLSPPFKDVIPYMAQEYGFKYELITYKWPTWLHKQKEKQRIIWAYKILFLDVIFPLSLKKVIFVDADQVVRADMGELYDMDLKGRPLAYTPFCDNNKEMDGYRFWRQGFWKDHLRGKPYHISALYVVDLVKFRQMAAGDTLRVYYETLSKDPNSLSNLDQDLPNYAQHTVPIFSLPQEWLWCESWCGNATKSRAKTIDLCNNPMTKEPKLQGARRIISEWVDLDAEGRSNRKNLRGTTRATRVSSTSTT